MEHDTRYEEGWSWKKERLDPGSGRKVSLQEGRGAVMGEKTRGASQVGCFFPRK